MNIDCTKWRELASEFIEDTLPADMKQAVTLHLRGCANCRQDEAALRAISRELNVLPEVDPPLFFRDNVISAIERQGTRPVGSWWQALWAAYGRLTIGASLGLAAVTALTFAIILPHQGGVSNNSPQVGQVSSTGLIPTSSTPVVVQRQPVFHVERMRTIIPGQGAAWDFSFNLENADRGTARFQLVGVDREYRFSLNGMQSQTLRIPDATVAGKKVVELHARWTADQTSHSRYLILPGDDGNATSEVRQSFGLPEYTIADIAREITARYGQAIILDDVPEDVTLRLTAQDETAEETLRRQLSPLGFQVQAMRDGLHISKAEGTSTAQP